MKFTRASSAVIRFVLAIGILAVAHLINLPGVSRWWAEILNLGHVFMMGAFSLIALGITGDLLGSRVPNRLQQYMIALGVTVAVGGLFELAQIPGPRDADIVDFVRDAAGALSFLSMYMLFDPQMSVIRSKWNRWTNAAIPVVAAGVILIASIPAIRWTAAVYYRNCIFPTLCTFNSNCEPLFWTYRDATLERVPPPEGWSRATDSLVGRMTCLPSPRSGFAINQVYPDWRAYTLLKVPLYLNETEPTGFFVQIEDREYQGSDADRFTYRTEISPGANLVSVPLELSARLPDGRVPDLRHIEIVYFYTADTTDTTELFIGSIGLQ
jgi:hypothetical protein